MHLSGQPAFEFGPLLALPGKRTSAGASVSIGSLGGVTVIDASDLLTSTASAPVVNVPVDSTGADSGNTLVGPPRGGTFPPHPAPRPLPAGWTRLTGMDDIDAHLEAGGFFNYYVAPQLRLTNTLLYGSGNARRGLRWSVDLQHIATDIAPHHSLSFGAGVSIVNAAYNQAWFGVTEHESLTSANNPYAPGAGIKDVHASARWNWSLGATWLLTTGVEVEHLNGAAARSPLVDRVNNTTAFSALAYRF
jgi:MipA family protein